MKKIFLTFHLLLFCSIVCFAQKNPKKLGLIQEFTGVVTNASSWDHQTRFTIKDLKIGEVEFYISTIMNDEYIIEGDIPDELMDKIYNAELKGKRVKVKAKSTYGVFFNYQGNGPDTNKEIIWRPIFVREL